MSEFGFYENGVFIPHRDGDYVRRKDYEVIIIMTRWALIEKCKS